MSSHKFLFIPIEISVRELDSKILMALFAAQRGYQVLFGENRFFENNIKNLPQGVLFTKSFTHIQYRALIRPAKQAGFYIAGMDEEGCNRYSDPILMRRLHPEATNAANLICVWGDVQSKLVRDAYPELDENKIVVTGSPRWDLMREGGVEIFQPMAESITNVFGPHILFCSNFGMHRKNWGEYYYNVLLNNRMIDPNSESDLAMVNRIVKYYMANFKAVVKDLGKLAQARPDVRFVIRPHPQEGTAFWKKIFQNFENVDVFFEGPPEPWIMAANSMMISGCTTGLQAVTMDKNVFTYTPLDPDEENNNFLANLACPRASTFDQALEFVDMSMNNPAGFEPYMKESRGVLADHITGLDGKLASERILDEIDAHLMGDTSLDQSNPIFDSLGGVNLKDFEPNNSKFPTSTVEEIEKRTADLANRFNIPYSGSLKEIRPKVYALT